MEHVTSLKIFILENGYLIPMALCYLSDKVEQITDIQSCIREFSLPFLMGRSSGLAGLSASQLGLLVCLCSVLRLLSTGSLAGQQLVSAALIHMSGVCWLGTIGVPHVCHHPAGCLRLLHMAGQPRLIQTVAGFKRSKKRQTPACKSFEEESVATFVIYHSLPSAKFTFYSQTNMLVPSPDPPKYHPIIASGLSSRILFLKISPNEITKNAHTYTTLFEAVLLFMQKSQLKLKCSTQQKRDYTYFNIFNMLQRPRALIFGKSDEFKSQFCQLWAAQLLIFKRLRKSLNLSLPQFPYM